MACQTQAIVQTQRHYDALTKDTSRPRTRSRHVYDIPWLPEYYGPSNISPKSQIQPQFAFPLRAATYGLVRGHPRSLKTGNKPGSGLRRKTPSGVLNNGYDATSVGSMVGARPRKQPFTPGCHGISLRDQAISAPTLHAHSRPREGYPPDDGYRNSPMSPTNALSNHESYASYQWSPSSSIAIDHVAGQPAAFENETTPVSQNLHYESNVQQDVDRIQSYHHLSLDPSQCNHDVSHHIPSRSVPYPTAPAINVPQLQALRQCHNEKLRRISQAYIVSDLNESGLLYEEQLSNQRRSRNRHSTPLNSTMGANFAYHYEEQAQCSTEDPGLHFDAGNPVIPEKILSWARAIYDSLVSAMQDAKKQEAQRNQCPRPGSLLHANVSSEPEYETRSELQPFERDDNALIGRRLKTHGQPINRPVQWSSPSHGVDASLQHVTSVSPCQASPPSELQHRQRQQQYPPSDQHDLARGSVYSISPLQRMPGRSIKFCSRTSTHDEIFTNAVNVIDLINAGRDAYECLSGLCHEMSSKWVDGMLLAGCLAHILGDGLNSVQWYSRVLELDGCHIEAMTNLGTVLLALDRRKEAEQYWRLAIRLRPSYIEAAEHLVSFLSLEQRRQDALEVIEYILQNWPQAMHDDAIESCSLPRTTLTSDKIDRSRREYDGDSDKCLRNVHNAGRPPIAKARTRTQLASCGENSRLIALIHAKGNILYSLQDYFGAAKAFEQVVLTAMHTYQTLAALIDAILTAASEHAGHGPNDDVKHSSSVREPLLLTPERALQTARYCFPHGGDPPWLRAISNQQTRKAAIAIISNSLLSLAKIYQDSMAPNANISPAPQALFGVRDILALYYLSFAFQPSPSTANNVGILLAGIQQAAGWRQRHSCYENGEAMFPGVIGGSGVWLALKYYQYGLDLDPKHAHLYTNLGSLLKDIGQLPLAIKMYEKAVTCDPNFDIALANLANAVKDQGKTGDAITYYKRAVQVNPNFSEAICGLANALNSVCSWAGRGGVALPRGSYDRWHVDDQGALVDVHTNEHRSPGWIQKVVDIAESQLADGDSWGRGVLHEQSVDLLLTQIFRHQPDDKTLENQRQRLRKALFSWSGQKHEGARIVRLVERAVRRTVWQWYQDIYIRRKEQPLVMYTRPQLPVALSIPSAPTVLPFHTFTIPMTAKQIRQISQRNGLRVSYPTLRAPWLSPTVYPPPAPPSPYLNVGYVSSDFNNHPLAHLMQSVFGMHDNKRVRAFCYAITPSDNSIHRRKIENEAPVFHDASGWPVERLVQQIVQDGIHILINLNGYTRGARNDVFAARPAPIQMSFMGFAGTLGAEWCDYILADETAIPVETLRPWRRNVDLEDLLEDDNNGGDNETWMYGENVIFTRGSFFCCDHRQSAASPGDEKQTWEAEQARRWRMRQQLFPTLRTDAVVYGNFNQLYKIDPTTFRTWLRILSRVPNAILWLLRFPDLGEAHLRATALAWAGPAVASRLIFTDVAPKALHIARACVIDLFLDTPECNAHTTSVDCLWSGTPLLTQPRYPWKMASRMAASILGGALDRGTQEGEVAWKELVTGSEEEYEETAVRLGRGLRYTNAADGKAEGRLMELRWMVWKGRWRPGGVFDTRSWVAQLEEAYEETWKRWVKGEGGDIMVGNLLDERAARALDTD